VFLIFRDCSDEIEESFGSRIVGQAEVFVEFVVRGFAGRKACDGDTGIFESGFEPLGLGGGVWMFGDVEDEKGRDAFVFGDVGDGGVVAVLGGIVTELHAVAEGR